MSKILYVHELCFAARNAALPGAEAHIAHILAAVDVLAEDLAKHIDASTVDTAQLYVDSITVGFNPSSREQHCPEVLRHFDRGGDWEVPT